MTEAGTEQRVLKLYRCRRVDLTLRRASLIRAPNSRSCYTSLDQSAIVSEGPDFDMMKEKFSFLTRVLEVTVTSVKRTV